MERDGGRGQGRRAARGGKGRKWKSDAAERWMRREREMRELMRRRKVR